jgi:hypothetical protein
MNETSVDSRIRKFDPSCAEQLSRGECELSALYSAIFEMSGEADARLFAEHWLESLTTMARLPETVREWRAITVNVSQQLAKRLDTLLSR